MAYATRTQIEARLPSVKMTDEEAGEKFLATVAEALVWADAEIDGVLVARYPVPFDPAPVVVSQLAADFAQVFMLRANSESEASMAEADKIYGRLVKKLEAMLKNGISGLEEAGEDLPAAEGVAYHSAYGCTSEIAAIEWDR